MRPVKYRLLTEKELDNLVRFPWKALVIGPLIGLVVSVLLIVLVLA